MQVKVSRQRRRHRPFNLDRQLGTDARSRTTRNGTGVFESGQHPIIVGQAAYNSAYGTSFAASGDCNAPGTPATKCDGFARINRAGWRPFRFNTLDRADAKLAMPLQPKAHARRDELGELRRVRADDGQPRRRGGPGDPGAQNITLYPYVNPATELIDATGLPAGDLERDARSRRAPTGRRSGRSPTTAWTPTRSTSTSTTCRCINRVTWDNIIIPPDPTELGWKDTVRISPLEDTIVALRPIIPRLPSRSRTASGRSTR